MKWLGAGLAVVAALVLGLVVVNWNSLDDGLRYVGDLATYRPTPAVPLDASGKFGFCNQFVTLRNAQRAQFIENFLDARDIPFERVPIYNSGFDDILVRFGDAGPYTIFSAHYDKRYDAPDYQGASDNSTAVCMLLVAAAELAQQSPAQPTAILFTGEEEVGLVGAKAFYDYASANQLAVAEAINLDNIGRGGLASRASGERSGYAFTIPFLGEYIYDGRTVEPAQPYQQPDNALLERLAAVAPLTRYDRMIAKSDGTLWQERGWNAVNLSSDNVYYLDVTWHTYGDRVELLDQTSLERALELVLGYARRAD